MKIALVEIATGRVAVIHDDIPNPLVWPNGDASHAALPGDERVGYRLVKVEYDDGPPHEFHHMESVEETLSKDTLKYTRKWAVDDLVSVKSRLIEKMNKEAERDIVSSVSMAQALLHLSHAIAGTGPAVPGQKPEWTGRVAAVERSRKAKEAAIQTAATVDEAIAAASLGSE